MYGEGALLEEVASEFPVHEAGAGGSTPNTVVVGVMSRQTLLKILQSRAGFCASLQDAASLHSGGARTSVSRLKSAMRALEALPLKPPTTKQGEPGPRWNEIMSVFLAVLLGAGCAAALPSCHASHHPVACPAHVPACFLCTSCDALQTSKCTCCAAHGS